MCGGGFAASFKAACKTLGVCVVGPGKPHRAPPNAKCRQAGDLSMQTPSLFDQSDARMDLLGQSHAYRPISFPPSVPFATGDTAGTSYGLRDDARPAANRNSASTRDRGRDLRFGRHPAVPRGRHACAKRKRIRTRRQRQRIC